MPSRWIEFVKEWSKNNNVSYGCALSDARMKAQYYKKYPKKLTKAQLIQKEEAEKATMLMEDVNVAKKEKKEKYKNRLNAVEASLDLKDFIQANKLLKELKTKDITNPDTRKKLKQLIIRFNNERPKKPSVPIEEEKILAQPVLKRRKTKELVEEKSPVELVIEEEKPKPKNPSIKFKFTRKMGIKSFDDIYYQVYYWIQLLGRYKILTGDTDIRYKDKNQKDDIMKLITDNYSKIKILHQLLNERLNYLVKINKLKPIDFDDITLFHNGDRDNYEFYDLGDIEKGDWGDIGELSTDKVGLEIWREPYKSGIFKTSNDALDKVLNTFDKVYNNFFSIMKYMGIDKNTAEIIIAENDAQPVLPTYQNIKDTRTPQQKVFDISDLDREIQSYLKDELSNIDEKLLKRLILEWLDRFIKVRGKINEKTKDWLNQSPIKIIDDFRVMYDRHKKGINNLPNLPVFKFTGDEFTPKKLKEYILLKIAEDPFSNWKVGDEGLINRNPVKVIKKDALELKVRFDEPSGRRYINDGYFEKFDSRTYKGSLMTLKKNNIEYLTKIPSNYDWEKFVDTRYG
jgi:hypothetical protein